MAKITKAQLAADNAALRAKYEELLARLEPRRVPPLDALGVERDERGCYVRRGDYATFHDALAASKTAAKTLGVSVRVM